MTTIAYRDGVMAADSRFTEDSEAGGTRLGRCEKLYRREHAIVGLAGESAPGLVFLDWYDKGAAIADRPELLVHGEADFSALVLRADGLYSYDKWCRGEKVLNKFWAIGSGAKAALGAMEHGASAAEAVKIACRIDPYSAPPVVQMTLAKSAPPVKVRRSKKPAPAATPAAPASPQPAKS